MNDPTPSETVRTHYQARDSELREAAPVHSYGTEQLDVYGYGGEL